MSYDNREDDSIVEPVYHKCQMIGDSQFLRFAEQILRKERKQRDRLSYLGLTVSGQKIYDLIERLENNFHPTSRRAVVMIGTNDLLQKTPAQEMRQNIETLVIKLVKSGVEELILLTIPPVPRLAKNYDHWSRLKDYNEHIRSLHNGKDIFVVDTYPKFIKNSTETECDSPVNTSKRHNSQDDSVFETSSEDIETCKKRSPKDESKIVKNSPRTTSMKRSRSSDSYETPTKRKSHSSFVKDDHNDEFGDEDISLYHSKIADEINYSLFEEYYSHGGLDLIHLNGQGLRVISELIRRNVKQLFGKPASKEKTDDDVISCIKKEKSKPK